VEVDDAFAREEIGGLLRNIDRAPRPSWPEERSKVNLSRVAQMTPPLPVAATTTAASHHPNKKWTS
jgi:hypothetical protein